MNNPNPQQFQYKEIKSALTLLAIIGNILFILWILYNGMNEEFAATRMEKIRYLGMVVILAINVILLGTHKRQPPHIVVQFITVVAGVGNIIFILFFLYNLFTGSVVTMPEKLSTIGLIGLLTVNSILVFTKKSPPML